MPSSAKGQRTEAALLNAAREVFTDKGYFNTKISDITGVAGRSTASFYNYYENKEQLLEALLGAFSTEVLEQSLAAKTGDPLDGIRGAVRAYWTSYKKYLPEMIGVFQMAMLDEGFARRWRANRAAGIRAVLTGLHSAERINPPIGLELDVLASTLVSMLEGFCWTWLAMGGDPDVDPPDDETAIETLATVWYRAVYGRVPTD
ncbi:TetR/AcrR family transcriptional regulator [Nocardia sp. 004]|uniref:TetR/AcrR family transcriptional regulator n=1 Tax=Nocardia sp. 004 TaxID=3385978 RepID=UPI00399FAE7D